MPLIACLDCFGFKDANKVCENCNDSGYERFIEKVIENGKSSLPPTPKDLANARSELAYYQQCEEQFRIAIKIIDALKVPIENYLSEADLRAWKKYE